MKHFIIIIFALISFTILKAQTSPDYNKWHGDSVNVLHYDIHLDITQLYERSISGYTEVTLTPVVESFNEFALDLLKMTIDSILIDDQKHEDFSYNDTIIHIDLGLELLRGEEIKVKIFYNGNPKKDPQWGGFYMSNSYAYNIGVGMGSDPVCIGRTWFPCVDDFVDRAKYDYYITIKDAMEAVCGGIKIGEENHNDDTKTVHWRSNQQYPTYLASVAVGDYAVISDSYSGLEKEIPIINYAFHEDSAGVVSSLRDIKVVMAVFEDLFGPYQFDRVGYVTVPFGAGAMEHAMNIAMAPSALDGSLDEEEIIYHELSHMWFGDWVTCKTANDMWINEGWASYCEAIFLEHIYGEERFRDYVRSRHDMVLKSAHVDDGNFYAVSNVPLDHTYGTTSYDKGADRVHTIRGYLGDELFYKAVKEYLIQFGDSCASSEDIRDVFTEATGIDMTDFFDAWIFSPGFPHFSIDAYSFSENGDKYDINLTMRQKLRAQETFANSNRVEVTVMDKDWNMETHLVEFDGEKQDVSIESSIYPEAVFVDHNEKISDAISNHVKTVNEDKIYYFSNTNLTVNVEEITDSAYISAEFNWVKPDKYGEQENGMIISEYFYWKVSGIFPEDFSAKGKFFYNINTFSDENLNYKFDTLRLVYREDANHKWHYIDQTYNGTPISGEITIPELLPGEYALATNIWPIHIHENLNNSGSILKVYPNPTKDEFNFEFEKNLKNGQITIYDVKGQVLYEEKIGKQTTIHWSPNALQDSIYFVQITSKGKILDAQKLLFMK